MNNKQSAQEAPRVSMFTQKYVPTLVREMIPDPVVKI